MLTGKKLGVAIKEAIDLKMERCGVDKKTIADHFGIKPPSLHGWINNGRVGKEHLFKLFEYFEDVVGAEHWGLTNEPDAARRIPHSKKKEGFVFIQLLDIAACMGHGFDPVDYPQVVGEIEVSAEWLHRSLGMRDSSKIKLISAQGHSMMPRIQDGDIVFVDTATQTFISPGIYVVILDGGLMIRHLKPKKQSMMVAAEDEMYTEEVPSEELDERLKICGRVLNWWQLRNH